jgi:hypothetical protein
MEKRAYKRLPTASHCDIDCAISDKIKIKDISIGGVCLETSKHIDINTNYSLNFVTKGIGKRNLKGKVVWSELKNSIKDKIDVIPIYQIGLKFIKRNDDHLYLEHLVNRLAHFE